MLRLRWLVAGIVGLLSLGLLPGVALAEGCPNEQFRTGLSAGLPDCRAYEMVSPVDKNDGEVSPQVSGGEWQSSADGTGMVYPSPQAFAGASTGASTAQSYLAARGAGGWSSQALLPAEAVSNEIVPNPSPAALTSDLTTMALVFGGGEGSGEDDPPLVPGEPHGRNVFVRDNSTGSYRLVNITPAGVAPAPAVYEGGSTDLSHVVFNEAAKLTGNAASEGPNLYEWVNGTLDLVSIAPGGGALLATRMKTLSVSEDGSRIVFRARFESSNGESLYLNDNGTTVQLDGSTPGSGGLEEQFQAASSDDSRIFFTEQDSRSLTADTVPGSGNNLYEYSLASGRLTDLTPSAHAEVLGLVLGASRDGSYLYFVAEGALAAGAAAGQPNLYVWHEGATSFIAALAPRIGNEGDFRDWGVGGVDLAGQTADVSQDGTRLAFESINSLTGYDSTDVNTGLRDSEVFLYDAATGRLTCASCDPSGARPIGSSLLSSRSGVVSTQQYRPRYLSPDGSRLFFNSNDAIVPQDVNGKEDVYEYEGGAARLISTGTSEEYSEFADASQSGDDVFFTTTQQLVSQDRDPAFDLYDARVGGGFPPVVVQASCGGEDCRQAAIQSAALGVPGSATFAGTGNLASLPGTPVVKAKAKAKKRKSKHRRKQKRKTRARRARLGARGHSTGKQG